MATDIVNLAVATADDMLTELNLLIQIGALSNGTIDIRNNAGQILATIALNAPEFNGPSVGVLTMNGTPSEPTGIGLNGGIADRVANNFRLFDRNSTRLEIFRGTVGVTGSLEAMELSSTTINEGDTVEMDSASSTITQPLP